MVPIACLFLFAFLYQLVALPLYAFDGIAPDFVLGGVCALSVYGRPGVALFTAILCGVAFDFLSLDPWSAHALGYVAASWTLWRLRRRGWMRDVFSRAVIIVAASVAATVVRSSIVFIHDGGAALPGWTAGTLEALYSGGVACLLVALVQPFREDLAGPRRRSEFHRTLAAD